MDNGILKNNGLPILRPDIGSTDKGLHHSYCNLTFSTLMCYVIVDDFKPSTCDVIELRAL